MLTDTCAGAPEKPLSMAAARAEKARDFKIRIHSSYNQSFRAWFALESCAPFAKVISGLTFIREPLPMAG
jgi:hypothetical protein